MCEEECCTRHYHYFSGVKSEQQRAAAVSLTENISDIGYSLFRSQTSYLHLRLSIFYINKPGQKL